MVRRQSIVPPWRTVCVAVGLITTVAGVTACGNDGSDSPPPRLLSANVVHQSLALFDDVPLVEITLELDGPPPCGDDPEHLYGIILDPDLEDDVQSEDPFLAGLDPQQRISARCEGGELRSASGLVTVEPGDDEITVLTIRARGEEIPAQFHWFAFVATANELQRSPATPGVELAAPHFLRHVE